MRIPNPFGAAINLLMAVHLYAHGGYSWRPARIVGRRIGNARRLT